MKKGVVLVVVIGVMLVIFTLALAALFLMTQESRISEHKIKRTRAFFAAQAGMVFALEQLRRGDAIISPHSVDSAVPTQGYPLTADITVNAGVGIAGTDEVIISVTY